MAKTKVIIGYSPNQHVCRTVVVPTDKSSDDWDERQVPMHVKWLEGMGEKALVVDMAEYQEFGKAHGGSGAEKLITRHTGHLPKFCRYAVLDDAGVIVTIGNCDPLLGDHAGKQLILDTDLKAEVGRHVKECGLA